MSDSDAECVEWPGRSTGRVAQIFGATLMIERRFSALDSASPRTVGQGPRSVHGAALERRLRRRPNGIRAVSEVRTEDFARHAGHGDILREQISAEP